MAVPSTPRSTRSSRALVAKHEELARSARRSGGRLRPARATAPPRSTTRSSARSSRSTREYRKAAEDCAERAGAPGARRRRRDEGDGPGRGRRASRSALDAPRGGAQGPAPPHRSERRQERRPRDPRRDGRRRGHAVRRRDVPDVLRATPSRRGGRSRRPTSPRAGSAASRKSSRSSRASASTAASSSRAACTACSACPQTETQGRIHTSAVTVAVLPEADEVEVHIEEKDLRIDTFCSSGPGGQSVNTTYSAVRITHLPTNTVVQCQDEKSWHKNKARALQVLRSRLYDRMLREQQDEDRRRSAAGMIGSGDRSEKIRTYNFPQNRVTDHRIGLTVHNLPSRMDGAIGDILEALARTTRPRGSRKRSAPDRRRGPRRGRAPARRAPASPTPAARPSSCSARPRTDRGGVVARRPDPIDECADSPL